MEKLAPKPYMIKSIRNRDIPAAVAISEFIDNSFAPGKGEARNVSIILEPHRLTVEDDGNGVDDINRLFQLGNHGEALDDDIGEFGVGASTAAINLGDVLQVASVYDRRVHQYTVDWERCLNTNWADPYVGQGRPAGTRRGTTLRIDRLRKQIRVSALLTGLGDTYAPALEQGRSITIVDERKNPREVVQVQPVDPPDVSLQVIKGSITVGGQELRWSGRAGYSPTLTMGRSHVEIAFGHRIIQQVKDPLHGCARVYARVHLSAGWKPFLSDNKTSVVEHREELFDSITQALQPLLALAQRENKTLHLKDITADLEDIYDLSRFASDRGDTGQQARQTGPQGNGHRFDGRRHGGEHAHPKRIRSGIETEPLADGSEIAAGEGAISKKRPGQGLNIEWCFGAQFNDVGGHDVPGKVDMSDGHVVVYLNQDLPILEAVHEGPGGLDKSLNELYVLIATLIAEEFNESWRKGREQGTGIKHFPTIMRRVRDLPQEHIFGAVMATLLNLTNATRLEHQR